MGQRDPKSPLTPREELLLKAAKEIVVKFIEVGRVSPGSLPPGYLDFAGGSCPLTWGRTRVLCAATVAEQVPPFRLHTGGGWVTAEYAMLPRATPSRMEREAVRGRGGGRTHEISRLIGRALRGVGDLGGLGPRTGIL